MVRLALVVDAEPALHEILRRALGPAGIEDLIPSSNAEAAGHLLATRFDLVFVDLRGSPIQGVELTGRIRQSGLNRTTPVILISGDQSKGELSRGFSAGANFHVHMPIEAGRLTKLIVHITAVEGRGAFGGYQSTFGCRWRPLICRSKAKPSTSAWAEC